MIFLPYVLKILYKSKNKFQIIILKKLKVQVNSLLFLISIRIFKKFYNLIFMNKQNLFLIIKYL